MTEAEAKERWCPFAQAPMYPIPSHGVGNRPDVRGVCDVQRGWTPCVGSACMAWRWGQTAVTPSAQGKDDSDKMFAEYRHSAGWRILHSIDPEGPQPMLQWADIRSGFCGLAGRP